MFKHFALATTALIAAIAFAVPAFGGPAAQTVRVTEVSKRITLSTRPKAGIVRFVVRNASDDPHDFWVRGGGKTWRTSVLAEGRMATLTARLKRGVRYQYWCGVGDHASDGMRGSFVVR